MSHIIKQTKGFLRTTNMEGEDVKKPIPLYRQTIIPKNKYSKQYQDAVKKVDSRGDYI